MAINFGEQSSAEVLRVKNEHQIAAVHKDWIKTANRSQSRTYRRVERARLTNWHIGFWH